MGERPANAGQCKTCGLLTVRETFSSTVGPRARFLDVSLQAREKGIGDLFCLVGAADLPKEVRTRAEKMPDRAGAAAVVLALERHCPEWEPHQQGLSPQEHLQTRRPMDLERHRQESEERIAQQNAVIAVAVAAATEANARAALAAERVGQQTLELARIAHEHNRRWTIVFAIFAIATFAVGILQLVVSAVSQT